MCASVRFMNEQVAAMGVRRGKADEPAGNREELLEVEERRVLRGVDQDAAAVDALGPDVEGERADRRNADEEVGPLDVADVTLHPYRQGDCST
jgi:hypothetical protein